MLPPGLNSPTEVNRYYKTRYESLTETRGFTPFVYPWVGVGAGIVLLYLLIDHRKSPSLKFLRYPLFGILCIFQAWCVLNVKARGPAASYFNGIISCWGCVYLGSIMVARDCQIDFRRIDRIENVDQSPGQDPLNGSISNGFVERSATDGALRRRKETLKTSENGSLIRPTPRIGRFAWQSYPNNPSIQRLDWVLDVFCSFRGVGWSFETAGIPPPPVWVQAELKNEEYTSERIDTVAISRTGIRRFSNRRELLKYCLPRLVVGYLALDLVKIIMHHDPYFWGYTDAAPPSSLPAIMRTSPVLTKAYRLLICLAAISFALTQVFRLGPVFFSGLLGPQIIGVRGEAWLNPPSFYGSWQPILDKGLAGWWGGFWHQTFRFGFEAPGQKLLEVMKLDKRSTTGRLVGLYVAFFLSGCLHMCGSYAQLGDTRPLKGPLRFFLLQPIGIVVQTAWMIWLKNIGLREKIPKLVGQITNLGFTLAWMYLTAPLLMDDFAQGGVWMYEPNAISPLRALGFGAKDDGWYDMWYGITWWRQGRHWWDIGFAF